MMKRRQQTPKQIGQTIKTFQTGICLSEKF